MNTPEEIRKTAGRLMLVLLSLVLFSLSMPGGPFVHLVWVIYVPLVAAFRGFGARRSALAWWFFGSLIWFLGVRWLPGSLESILHKGPVTGWSLSLMLYAINGLPFGLFGYLLGRAGWLFEKRWGALRASVALTSLLTAFTAVFPGNISHFLYVKPKFIQVLDIGGMPLMLLLVTLVNFLFAQTVLRLKESPGKAFAPAAAAVAVIAALFAYGTYRITVMNGLKGPAVTVGAVQPNVPVPASGGGEELDALGSLIETTGELKASYPDIELAVWPEVSGPHSFYEHEDDRKRTGDAVKGWGFELMTTGYVYEDSFTINGAEPYYNTVFYIGRDAYIKGIYRKKNLMPFGEYLPLERSLPVMRSLFPEARRFIPGDEYTVFSVKPGINVIPAICYEAILTDAIREFVLNGGNVIITMANDVWFGRGNASEFHFALSLFRAVEYRVPMAHVANSGLSAFVSHTGEIVKGSMTGKFKRDVRAHKMIVPGAASVYLSGGWMVRYLIHALFLADVAIILWSARRKRKAI